MVRRVDRYEEDLIWCRKCSVYARQSLVSKLMNQCKLEKMETEEFGKMLKRMFNSWRREGSCQECERTES